MDYVCGGNLPSENSRLKVGKESELSLKEIIQAKASLEPQPAMLEIEAPVVIFGDIHGQLRDLLRWLTLSQFAFLLCVTTNICSANN